MLVLGREDGLEHLHHFGQVGVAHRAPCRRLGEPLLGPACRRARARGLVFSQPGFMNIGDNADDLAWRFFELGPQLLAADGESLAVLQQPDVISAYLGTD